MYLGENETPAAAAPVPETPAPAPETTGPEPETKVPIPETTAAPTITQEVKDAIKELVETEVAHLAGNVAETLEQYRTDTVNLIDKVRAELTALFGKKQPEAASRAVRSPDIGIDELEVGDPVKVWTDAEHKTFHVGEIAAVHDGNHAFDVKLDGGSVTKVPADGLEYDDRKI